VVAEAAPEPREFGLEAYLLTCLLRVPSLLERLDQTLAQVGIGPLETEDFQDAQNRAFFELWQEAINSGTAVGLEHLRRMVDASLQPHLDFLLARAEAQPPLADDQWEKEALVTALRLRLRNLRGRLEGVRFLLAEAEASQDQESIARHRQTVVELTQEIEKLDHMLAGDEGYLPTRGLVVKRSSNQLVTWPERTVG